MKNVSLARAALVLLLPCSSAFAGARTSGSYSLTDATDTGGRRATSANYIMDVSLGGIAGVSTSVPPADVVRYGYVGQLTEVSSVSLTGTPAQVNECSASQLRGTATMDDATVTALAGSDIAWSATAWPIQSINVSGVATTMAVYANTPATMNGKYLGVSGSGSLLVLDSISDNYGSYAGDGLPDSWQVLYFGQNNPNAAPTADADGTRQNNLFKYVAGLDPTNPASVFVLDLANVAAGQADVVFHPRLSDRTYTVVASTNLLTGNFTPLVHASTNDIGAQRSVTDLAASDRQRFYRVRITYP